MTYLQLQVLRTIADAKAGEISGKSICAWLERSRYPEGIYSVLRSLLAKELILERPTSFTANGHTFRGLAFYSLTEKGREELRKDLSNK